ncbi:MAG: PAS domain-containing protein [Candidatus Competibacteraceae bacterium]
MIGTHLNITERKRTEVALRESEERFAKAFHASPAPMAISDIETGRFLDVNARLLRMLDYTREQMIGHVRGTGRLGRAGARGWMIAQLRADGSFSGKRRPALEPERARFDRRCIRREILRLGDRRSCYLSFTTSPRKNAPKEALRASRRSGQHHHASPLPIVIFDTTGKIVRGNPASRALLGPTADHDFDESAFFERYNLFQDEQLRARAMQRCSNRWFARGKQSGLSTRYDVRRLQFPSSALPPR